MKPTIGRMVHYHEKEGRAYPAIVHDVHSDTCLSLNVFTYVGVVVKTSVMQGEAENQWSWPVIPDRPLRSDEIILGPGR